MKKFSIVTTVYNTYELVRQLVESAAVNLEMQYLDKFIIVDDFSNRDTKLHQYYDYLESTYDFIKVLRFKEYRPNIYDVRKEDVSLEIPYDSFQPNLGPALAVQYGLEHVESDLVLVVDSDTFFLRKSVDLLRELVDCFNKFPNVMCIGQVLGLNSHELTHFDKLYHTKLANNYRNGTCGEVSPMIYACRMSGWNKEGLTQISYGPGLSGWNNTYYMMSIFQESFKTMNFPIFSKGYMVHVGGATLKKVFAFTTDNNIYGGKSGNTLRDYYSGVWAINMSLDEYRRRLEDLGNLPFEKIYLLEEEHLIELSLQEGYEFKGIPTEVYAEQFFDPNHKFFLKPRRERTPEEIKDFKVCQRARRKGFLEVLYRHVRQQALECRDDNDMMKISEDLGEIHTSRNTDKGYHGYTRYYDLFFRNFRNQFTKLLEIGIGEVAAGLEMFGNYLPKALLYGIDNVPSFKKSEERFGGRLQIFIGDQKNLAFLSDVMSQTGKMNIIIDDGGHYMDQQIATLKHLWSWVNSGGVYVIEDIFTSFEGTFIKDQPENTMKYLQHLVDVMAGRKGKTPHTPKDDFEKDFLETVEGVFFAWKIVFIFKK